MFIYIKYSIPYHVSVISTFVLISFFNKQWIVLFWVFFLMIHYTFLHSGIWYLFLNLHWIAIDCIDIKLHIISRIPCINHISIRGDHRGVSAIHFKICGDHRGVSAKLQLYRRSKKKFGHHKNVYISWNNWGIAVI